MKYWTITFEWHTRPRFRKGRIRTCKVAFAAHDLTEVYVVAKKDGETRFPRHNWRIIGCEELTVPSAS